MNVITVNWAPLYRGMMQLAAKSLEDEDLRESAELEAEVADTFWSGDYEYEITSARSHGDLLYAIILQIESYQEVIQDYYSNRMNFAPGYEPPPKIEFNPIALSKIRNLIKETNPQYT